MVHRDTGHEIAANAIKEIYQLWQVDANRAQWVGDKPSSTEPYGFDWWPGDFKVAVRIFGPHPELGSPLYRLSTRSEHVLNVNVGDPSVLETLSVLNRFAPTFSFVSLPKEIAAKYGENPKLSKVYLESVAYLHEGISGWLPKFFAGQTILQPIESQVRAASHAELLRGQPDRSKRPNSNLKLVLDDMLGVGADYAFRGRAQSKWIGTGEFEEIIDKWGRSDSAFGTADETGLTIETPFGDDSALLTLKTNQPHPHLGNGLQKIPHRVGNEKAISDANWLNYLESSTWTSKRMPFAGSWTTDTGRTGEPELRCVAYSSFIPNFIYFTGVAENLVLWGIARTRWVREILCPDVVDLPMYEILSRRGVIQQERKVRERENQQQKPPRLEEHEELSEVEAWRKHRERQRALAYGAQKPPNKPPVDGNR